MAYDVLHDCPVCHKALHVTRLHCPSCGTTIEGDFQAERLLALTPEQRSFVYSFLRNRGNIREMEKELGISYPTVRARLDQGHRGAGHRARQGGGQQAYSQRSAGNALPRRADPGTSHGDAEIIYPASFQITRGEIILYAGAAHMRFRPGMCRNLRRPLCSTADPSILKDHTGGTHHV